MNYKLLIFFLLFEIVEFSVFWFVAGFFAPHSQLQLFLAIIFLDVVVSEIVFPGAFVSLYRAIFPKP